MKYITHTHNSCVNRNIFNTRYLPKISRAGCIITDSNIKYIILVKNRLSFEKGENKFGLPKGHIYKNESIYQAAIRETYEETGLNLFININTPYIIMFDTIYFIIRLNKNNNLNLAPIDKNEILSSDWHNISNISHLNLNRSLTQLVKKWENIFKSLYNE